MNTFTTTTKLFTTESVTTPIQIVVPTTVESSTVKIDTTVIIPEEVTSAQVILETTPEFTTLDVTTALNILETTTRTLTVETTPNNPSETTISETTISETTISETTPEYETTGVYKRASEIYKNLNQNL